MTDDSRVGFIELVNKWPAAWTLGVGLFLYVVAMATVLLAGTPHQGSFTSRFLTLVGVGVVLIGYHWFVSRFVRDSVAAQVIHLTLALIPVAGTALIMSGL